ncbi:binding-protein-dependent transport systems inner membrane component [Mycoavidus cysteinexigens]|uniref:Binding-protein-dependent transport systems inner membrane component n=1 Tax=Mycoavidus cysteinexigens TaxID=1553431 RepID=A0A2Z6ETV0_9BURK|nr:ABC transporter permease subunit [Mycoavidus cysteinexigens]BBE08857.1 binding-protein-dependent transport systems inner membrane component [Mycoavidus cysteinexigens]GLR02208.1 spermidine/putrescine ABC transporter ATP-binding protein [Mycoavidus cysteinexigens]
MRQTELSGPALTNERARLVRSWRLLLRGLCDPKFYLGAPIIFYLLLTLALPIAQLLGLSFQPEGKLGLAHYGRLFLSPVYLQVLAITFKTAAYTTLFAVVGGYPVAYLITFAPSKFKSSLLFWVLLPFWTSFLVRTFGWMVLLGRNGMVNQILTRTGMTEAPLNLLYHFPAVLTGMIHAMMPLAILTMLSVMKNIDRTLPRASLTLGAKPARAFWTIYFPLSLPGVAAAALMVFVTSIGFFITPALLGGRKEIMMTQIIMDQIQSTLNWGFAGAVSMLLLVAVLAVFVLYSRLIGLSSLAGEKATAAQRAPGHAHMQLRSAGYWVLERLADIFDGLGSLWRLAFSWSDRIRLKKSAKKRPQPEKQGWVLRIVAIAMLAFLIAPILVMIPISFTESRAIDWPPRGFSLQWYEAVFESPNWSHAALRSILIGISTGFLSMLIGTPAAFLLARSNFRWKVALLGFILTPMIVPRMILAIGFFYLFAKLGLVGSMFGLVLGHTTIALPYVVITIMAVLKNYDVQLDTAAQSLGASRLKTLRYITFPILSAGLASAFLFAFATSFDELTIALFVTGGLSATLPKQFWDEITLNVSPTIAAVSTCLFFFVAIIIGCADRLRRRSVK